MAIDDVRNGREIGMEADVARHAQEHGVEASAGYGGADAKLKRSIDFGIERVFEIRAIVRLRATIDVKGLVDRLGPRRQGCGEYEIGHEVARGFGPAWGSTKRARMSYTAWTFRYVVPG